MSGCRRKAYARIARSGRRVFVPFAVVRVMLLERFESSLLFTDSYCQSSALLSVLLYRLASFTAQFLKGDKKRDYVGAVGSWEDVPTPKV